MYLSICIEDSMRRRHRRPRIRASAGCDSFCKLLRLSGRGRVGTVVDLYGSWRFLPILGDSLQILESCFCRFYYVCVPLLVREINARSGAKSH